MRIKIGLRGQLACAIAVLVGGSVAISAWAQFELARNAMLDRLRHRELPAVLDAISLRIEQELARPIEVAHGMAENAYVIDWVDAGEDPRHLAEVQRYLARVRQYSGANASFLVSNRTLHYYTADGLFRTLERNRARDGWFFDFLAKAKTHDLSFDIDEVSQRATVFVNYAIGAQPSQQRGVVGVGVELAGLVDMVRKAKVGERGRVYLVAADGKIHAHRDPERIHHNVREEAGLSEVLLRQSRKIHDHSRGTESWLVGSRFLPSSGWYVAVELPEDEVLAPLRSTLEKGLELAALLAVLGVFLGLWIGRVIAGALLARAEQAELIDHMRQALVVFDSEGKVRGETSRRAHEIFGTRALRQNPIAQLLFPDSPAYDPEVQAFADWLTLAFEAPPDRWDEVQGLAPREVVLHIGHTDETRLGLEFRPLIEQDRTVRVMLLATDVTAQYRLEEARRAQQTAHERELLAMRQLIGGGADLFIEFLSQSAERIDGVVHFVKEAKAAVHMSDIAALFRKVHTIRGEARAFGQDHLERAVIAVEDRIAQLREDATANNASIAPIRDVLLGELTCVQAELERCRTTLTEASPLGRAALDRVTVRRSDVALLAAIVDELKPHDGVVRLKAIVSRLSARPFGEIGRLFVDNVPRWAEESGKRAVLDIQGKDVAVPSQLAGVLRGVLAHLVRNAIAHGIEVPSQRAKADKHKFGRITLCAREVGSQPTIVVSDDGAGIDVEAVRMRALALGLDVRDADSAELVFQAGLSTASEGELLAGRGVGLDAVRQELSELGYLVRVRSTTNQGTEVELAPRLISLSPAAESRVPAE